MAGGRPGGRGLWHGAHQSDIGRGAKGRATSAAAAADADRRVAHASRPLYEPGRRYHGAS